ncbi:MAG: hypothetical protein K0R50_4512 [Eubacterium sp.]|nr:hypothetical protein [Eubacterium sp.]
MLESKGHNKIDRSTFLAFYRRDILNMGKRIIIKTTLICIGIFLILNSAALAYIFKKYPLDLEKYIPVVVAISDIEPGTIIEPRHVRTRLIQQPAVNDSMLTELSSAIGKKTCKGISRSDYLRDSDLIERSSWYEQDERIIILPVSVEERLANLIQKGSYVDIRLRRENSSTVETVLRKIKVEDMLDENGISFGTQTGINSKTAYMKLVLNDDQRKKIYASKIQGQLIYELYCDETQLP